MSVNRLDPIMKAKVDQLVKVIQRGKPAVAPQLPRCPLLGEPTGELIACDSCGDRKTQLKVMECKHYGTCLPTVRVPGRGFCGDCQARPIQTTLGVKL